MEKLVKEFREVIERINYLLVNQIQHETQMLSTAMISHKKKTQQDAVDENSKTEIVTKKCATKCRKPKIMRSEFFE